jgi:CDP-glucose 4,6-dehydratase
MAAQSLVRASYADPVQTYATNVMGTVHVLEAVRQFPGAGAVVCVTSDKCYENLATDVAYRETDAMGGHDPYSSSKACAELVVSAYRRSFFPPEHLKAHGVAVASARAGNVIGGGDWASDRLAPDLMRAFAAGERPRIRFPDAIRPWQHVLEPLRGYLMLAQRLAEGEAEFAEGWNFGQDAADARSVRWVADRLSALWGEGAGWDLDGGSQPHEAHVLQLDSSKARERLGWRPAWGLDEGLRQVVDWHRALALGENMQDVTLMQIGDHARVAAPESARRAYGS